MYFKKKIITVEAGEKVNLTSSMTISKSIEE